MSKRVRVTLTDQQFTRLQREARATGIDISELIRRAIASTYGGTASDDAEAILNASFGAWRDRDLDGAEYVERIRRGLGARLDMLTDQDARQSG